MDEEEGDIIGLKKLKCLPFGGFREVRDYGNVAGGTKTKAGQKSGCYGGRDEGPPGNVLDD